MQAEKGICLYVPRRDYLMNMVEKEVVVKRSGYKIKPSVKRLCDKPLCGLRLMGAGTVMPVL